MLYPSSFISLDMQYLHIIIYSIILFYFFIIYNSKNV
jgi:hypothetical protein